MRRMLLLLVAFVLVSTAGPLPGAGKGGDEVKITAVMAAAGAEHSLVLLSDGTVLGFGLNGDGQAGQEKKQGVVDRPKRIAGLVKMVGIAAGSSHSYAWDKDGKVWAWGYNGENRLGGPLGKGKLLQPSRIYEPMPIELDKVKAMASGAHTLALRGDGKVWAWGLNRSGEIGNGNRKKQYAPTETHLLEEIAAVAAGGGFSLALTSDGEVWSWGNNSAWALGDGTKLPTVTPGPIRSLKNVKGIAACVYHGVACTDEGKVFVWGGTNGQGELGLGHKRPAKVPEEVPGVADVVAVSAGDLRTLALTKDGNVWSWGSSRSGEDPTGKGKPAGTPAPITALRNIKHISAGYYHSLAIDARGDVWVWGLNSNGQLGIATPGEFSVRPTRLPLPPR